ncbi:MAG: glycoside hydrolase family 127 protein [Acidobacteria bacterium]|nr:glycoside hydrolase family 127 protein [Acidobacteriota bacterium]
MRTLRFWLIVSSTLLAGSISSAPAPQLAKLRPVPFTDVRINDSFWAPRREINRTVTIPVNLDNLIKAGNMSNLELAGRRATSGYKGPVYMDSDVYKAVEAASYSLATHPDAELDRRVDGIIAVIAAAQHDDGYLNSYFTVKEPGRRWVNLRDQHELYCAGHLFEAAVAHYQATGKRSLLDIAMKFADNIDSVFGPGKRMGYPGHPEIELALVKLWKATGEQRYFRLARFFVENRGRKFFADEHGTPPDKYDGSYWQDDVPIYDHRNIKGHAVRACYLMSGVTDVAAETGDAGLLRMIGRVWRNTTERNQYLTGGIGPSAHNEGFTVDYDLPNLTAYQETCATVALAQWSHRLALLYGDARYADAVERALYNGVLAGVSQDGKLFFYVNPLESRGAHHRRPWYGTACCPPNVARTLASLGGYAYAWDGGGIWENLHIQGSVTVEAGGEKVTLNVTTDYPWDGKVILRPQLSRPAQFDLRLRVPGWCTGATVSLNGSRINDPKVEKGYIVLARAWRTGDTVELDLPMTIRRTTAHPNVEADRGLYAIERGPIVYCVEAVDHSVPLKALYLPLNAELKAERVRSLLGGVVAIKGFAEAADEQDWGRMLYQRAAAPRRVPLVAVPYYSWDNRTPGAMRVWLPAAPPVPAAAGPESRAEVAVSFVGSSSQPSGINDGVVPRSSNERPAALCHWWPHRGTEEWAQYTWKKPLTLCGSKVYWLDDTGRGSSRLPASWQLQYLSADGWKPVAARGGYPVARDKWCEVAFDPVTTTALRLTVKLQKDWAAGVHEWKVVEADEE